MARQQRIDQASSLRAPAWARWWIPGLIAVLILLVFGSALSADLLVFDDEAVITENSAFRGLSFHHLGWMFGTRHMGHYQPMTWLSYALDATVWSPAPRGSPREAHAYHATSLVFHALTAIAFYFLALRVFVVLSSQGAGILARSTPTSRFLAAGVSASFFALHPLRVESVVWVTERRDVVSGLFFVLALLLYLARAPQGGGGQEGSRLAA